MEKLKRIFSFKEQIFAVVMLVFSILLILKEPQTLGDKGIAPYVISMIMGIVALTVNNIEFIRKKIKKNK